MPRSGFRPRVSSCWGRLASPITMGRKSSPIPRDRDLACLASICSIQLDDVCHSVGRDSHLCTPPFRKVTSTHSSCASSKPTMPVSHHQPAEVDEEPKPKRQRTALACDSCRSRKTRCDGARPCCSVCSDMDFRCVYTRPARLSANTAQEHE